MTDLTEATGHLTPDTDWWRQATVYQIYPRSFADADGDGIGDLRGITSRIGYLDRLGVDAVWISPFYPSALSDGGYDVDDPRGVDPRLGTLEDFDDLVAAAHAAGIRVIVDIVPNHTSDRHPWFTSALEAGPGSAERDRYHFRDGSEPPSDWVSQFGGPAWTQVADGQWYLHTHSREQPDLNWDNPEVREDALATLKFWADRGVDGFRVDVAHMLAKDLSEDPLPTQADLKTPGKYADGQNPTVDRDELKDIYAGWRELLDSYDPPRMAVAEAWVPAHRRPRYASADSLGQAFNFDLLRAGFVADQFRDIIRQNVALAKDAGSSSTWVFSNHDVVRHATRYGLARHTKGKEWLSAGGSPEDEDRVTGLNRARAATLLAMALPGSMYIYQGEELGLPEVGDIPDDRRQDPTYERTGGEKKGRDGCRVPLPWAADAPGFGFSGPAADAAPPHLPQPDWFGSFAADAEDADQDSTLNFYRWAIALRHELQTEESLEWISGDTDGDDTVAFRRPNGWESYTNMGDDPAAGPLPENVILCSDPTLQYTGELPPDTTVWARQA